MKTTKLEHGTAFSESFSVTLRGEVEGDPVGFGSRDYEVAFLESELKRAVTKAIESFYQCRLLGTSLEVSLKP